MPYPSHFPPNCPPSAATEHAGVLYRFVDHLPPTSADFVSYLLTKGAEAFEVNTRCKASGLSVFKVADDAKAAANAVPSLRKKTLAEGAVNSAWGVVAPTSGQPGHHTWWVPDGKEPHTLFTVLEAQ